MGITQPQGEPKGVDVSGSVQIWSQAARVFSINEYIV